MAENLQEEASRKTLFPRASSVLEGVRYEHLVSGVAGGVVAAQILHPLDLIRIRFSVYDGTISKKALRYSGVTDAMRTIVHSEGFKGLYRGASAGILGAGTSWGLYFLFYNAAKHQLRGADVGKQLTAAAHLGCAASSGVVTLAMTNAIFVVKTRLCLDAPLSHTGNRAYSNVFDGLWKLVRYEGVRGMYKGFVPGLLGVSHGAIQFMTYEELKKLYCNYYHIPITTKLSTAVYLSMAAMSKVFAVVTTFPYQVIRARLQDQETKYTGILDTVTKTYRFEGVRGFYKGLVPNVLKVTPAVCLTFVVYEHFTYYLQQKR
jgi:solute carrier family 25 folate transporter 32